MNACHAICRILAAGSLLVTSAARADDGLAVYPPVPGLAASEHYQVRARSASDGGEWRSEWRSAFA